MKSSIWLTPALLILAVLFFMVAGYCALALVQAGSLYIGARLDGNVRFWGSVGLASLTLSATCAVWLGLRVAKALRRPVPPPA